jgi:carbon-monoxide dehydrogenase large subunit
MGEFAIGQPVHREEDPRFVSGRGTYFDDVNLNGQVWGWLLRSPHAHAKIVKLDLSAALAAPGVLAVLTGADWQAEKLGNLPCEEILKTRDGATMYLPAAMPLAVGSVKLVGDAVAFVVAQTRVQARDAAELIDVEYDPLPAVARIEDAIKLGAPKVWDDTADNHCYYFTLGDKAKVEDAFRNADRIVRRKMVINRITAAPVEPRGCLGHYDGRADRYTLYAGVQRPHRLRAQLAQKIFGVPETKVRVVSNDVGGSFGMRAGAYREFALTLWASKKIGRPVKWLCDRSEGFMSDDHARDNLSEIALALKNDGTFLGLRVTTYANLGAYIATTGPRPPILNLGTLAGVYRTPAAFAEVHGVFTNTMSTSPYRGSGAPEAAYLIERIVDIAARELDLDPAELRRRNCVQPEQMPWVNAFGHTYDCGDFPGNLEKALCAIHYDQFEQRRRDAAKRGKLRGLGISNTVKKTSASGLETASVRFDPSGTVTLMMGSINHGQGHETTFKQILCDRLGLDPANVRYVQGDTDVIVNGTGTFNSRSIALGGSALDLACRKIVKKAKAVAAHLFEASPEEVEFVDGDLIIPNTNRKMSLTDVAKASFQAKLPQDIEAGLDETGVFTPRALNWPTGVQVCEIEVDAETGRPEIVDFVCVDDVGTVINPVLLKGQMYGGILQGVGQALMENIAYDAESGQLLSGSFMDYCMPRSNVMPHMSVISAPVPTQTNLLGAKGAGESGPTGALPATINAVVDALKPYGIDHIDMPATSESIWRAIQAAKAGGAKPAAAEQNKDVSPLPR